jgi:hypothetical protein
MIVDRTEIRARRTNVAKAAIRRGSHRDDDLALARPSST